MLSMTRPASELSVIETIDNSSSTHIGDLWLRRLSNHVSLLHMLSSHQEHEYNTIHPERTRVVLPQSEQTCVSYTGLFHVNPIYNQYLTERAHSVDCRDIFDV